MYTRKDYLDNKCTHREYYAQHVTDGTINTVLCHFSKAKLKKAHLEDENLNSIPMAQWDNIGHYISIDFEKTEDARSLGGVVCVLKEAARQIIES